MLYSTSPSSSHASSSGRSSPDRPPSSGHGFLPPFFHSLSQPAQQPQQAKPSGSLDAAAAADTAAAPPRRTSFATALGSGGKLSALSTLGFFPSSATLGTSPTDSSTGILPRKADMDARNAASRADGNDGRTGSVSDAPVQAPKAPPKRHMCFPDGMGGTMCVEIRDRNRRGSS